MAWAAIEPVTPPVLAIGCTKAEQHLCQQIPGCNYNREDRIWRLPLTWPGYVCFRTAWAGTPITIYPDLLDYGKAQWDLVQERYADRTRIDAEGEFAELVSQAEADSVMELRPDQRGGVAWLLKYGRAGIEDPTGNGKTPVLIRALQCQQRLTGSALPALYVAAGSALYAIRDKFSAWAPELKVSVVTGTITLRAKALEAEADVYLMAWENIRLHTRLAPYGSLRLVKCPDCGGQDPKVTRGRCEVHLKELNTERVPRTVIADEAHRLREPKSKQTRALWWLAHHAEFFWPLTGTLAASTAADPWGIMHAMNPKAWSSRSRYLDMFAVKDYSWHGGAEILGIRPEHAYQLHSIIQPYWRRIPREVARPFQPDRMDPEFRYPEMSPKQLAAYKQLAREMQADLEGATVVTGNTLEKYTRLCQLASSMITVEDGEDRQGFTTDVVRLELPSNKADDLLEFVQDTEGQIVVAAISPALIELAERKLNAEKITTAKITGGMSREAQYQANMWFQEGRVKVIFINAAGSESIDLQAASTIYFMEPDTSFLVREQKVGRVDRYGQQFPVRQVYALSPGTIDQRRYKLGCDKQERHDAIARDPDLLRWILGEETVNWSS